VEDILALILIFGGGTVIALSFSPVGRAVADRLRHGPQPIAPPEIDHEVYDELDRLRADVTELQERVDFSERLLSKGTAEHTQGSAGEAQS
jgi:ubiquinone biosynthesis protein UbiJ